MYLAEHAATFPVHVTTAALRRNSLAAFEATIRGYGGTSIGKLLHARPGHHLLSADIAHLRGEIEVSIPASRDESRVVEELVRAQYLARGYRYHGPPGLHELAEKRRRGIPVVARSEGRALGTITLGIDSSAGLLVDDANREHLDVLRTQGRRLGEVVKLAVSNGCDSVRVIAALFAAAHGLMVLHGLSDVFIEVNPRHAAFYHRALCFAVAGTEKMCPRVAAPSILMRLTVSDLTKKIATIETALVRSHWSDSSTETVQTREPEMRRAMG